MLSLSSFLLLVTLSCAFTLHCRVQFKPKIVCEELVNYEKCISEFADGCEVKKVSQFNEKCPTIVCKKDDGSIVSHKTILEENFLKGLSVLEEKLTKNTVKDGRIFEAKIIC